MPLALPAALISPFCPLFCPVAGRGGIKQNAKPDRICRRSPSGQSRQDVAAGGAGHAPGFFTTPESG
jgi:hypothetical protein